MKLSRAAYLRKTLETMRLHLTQISNEVKLKYFLVGVASPLVEGIATNKASQVRLKTVFSAS